MKTKLKTTLALLAAFCGLQLFAATQMAVFEGDNLNGGTSGGYTLNLNGNTYANGAITITSATKGLSLTSSSTWSGKDNGITAVIRYSSLVKGTGSKQLASFKLGSKNDCVGVRMNSDGGSAGTYAGNDWSGEGSGSTKGVAIPASDTVFVAFKDSEYTKAYKSNDSGTRGATTLYYGSGLRESGMNVGDLITIASADNGKNIATDMVITGIAIYQGFMSSSEMSAFKWPSEALNDAYLWLDASDASTITRDANGMVTKWASRNAGGKAAVSYSAGNVNAGPTIKPQGLGGKNVVDFGAAGSQKDLKFDKSTTIRTVFMVAAVANNNNNNTFFLGDDSAIVFHRGDNGKYFNSTYAGIFTSGTVRRNGETVSNPGNVSVPTSYGVYTFVSTGNATASRICQDRNVSGRQGGKQVAELIIFNKVLSDAERDWIENYLTSKWMSGAPEPTLSQGFDGNKNASAVLGGTAATGWDEWKDADATYTAVRGTETGKALNLSASNPKVVPNNHPTPTGLTADTSWSVHASMMLADVSNGVLFSLSSLVYYDNCKYIGVEYCGNDQVRVVYGTTKGSANKQELIAPMTVTGCKDAYHSYLLTFDAAATSGRYALYVDGVKKGDSGDIAKLSGYAVGYAIGNYYGGADSVGSAVFGGAKVDDFAIWATTCLTAEQAKGVASQFPTWPRIYTASVTGDGNWSTLDWQPAKPAGGFPAGADFVITNNGAADVTTVTIDAPVNANSVKVVSATKVLKFGHISNLTASSYDFSEASGGVGFGVTGGWVVTEPLKSYIRCNNIKVIFDSDDTNGATFDYGSTEAERISVSPWISSHVVFNRGTHTFKGTSEKSDQSFGANATADNPTFYAKNGATVNWYSRNPCGWSVQANKNGIIRIDGTSKIKTLNSESGTWYWAQQFYLDPGAQLEIAAEKTCLTGGANENAPHFFMPESQNGTATISSSGSGAFRLTKDSNPGIGVSVGEGSTLLVTASLASTATQSYIAKYGTGALKFTGNTTSYQGGLQVKAGQMIYASASSMMAAATVSIDSGAQFVFGAANNTFANVISGAGAVVKDGTDTTTTLSGANTYSGGTTVTAGTLKLTGSSIGTGSYTVNSGATLDFGTHRDKTIVGTSAGTVKITLTDAEKTTLDGKGSITPFNVSGDAFAGTLEAFDGEGAVYEVQVTVSESKIVVTKKEGARISPFHVTNPTNETWTIAGWTDSSTPALEVRPEDWGHTVSANVTVDAEQEKTLTANRVLTLGTLAVTNAGTLTVSASDANTMTMTELLVNNTGTLALNGNAITTGDINDTASTGATTIGFAPGAATIKAGANTILNTVGTGAYTIGANKKLTVKGSGLTASKVTNNGTLVFDGGSAGSPLTVTGNAGLTATLAAGAYVKNTVNGNQVHNITGLGENASSVYALAKSVSGGIGMTSAAFTNLTLVSEASSGEKLWIERMSLKDVRFVANGTIYLADMSPTILSLSGAGAVTMNGTKTLTINCDTPSTYTGASSVPFTIGGTAVQTLSGNYTGALTVNGAAAFQASAATMTLAGNITVADGKTLTVKGLAEGGTAVKFTGTISGTGTIALDANVTSVDFGQNRPTNVTFGSDDTTVQFTEVVAEDGVLNVSSAFTGRTITVMGLDGTIHPLVGGRYTPTVCGAACLYDYTFTNKTATTSSKVIKAASTSQVTNKDLEGDVYAVYTNYNATTEWYTALRTTVRPHNKGGFTLTTPFSVAVAGCFPSHANTVLASFGSSKKCLFLSSGDKENEVKLVSINASSTAQYYDFWASDCTVLTTMSVPDAATAQHTVVFETADMQTINIYLDGVKWSTYEFDSPRTIQTGFQVGGWYGGNAEETDKCYRQALDTATDKTATNSYVSAVRIFNVTLGPNAVKAFADEFTYDPPSGSYARTIETATADWDSADAWTFSKGGTVNVPAAGGVVKLTASAETTVAVNLAENVSYNSLELNGPMTIATNATSGTHGGKISSAGKVQIFGATTLDYGAIDISGSPLTVGSSGSVCFDMAAFDASRIFKTDYIQLTGTVDQNDAKFSAKNLPPNTAERTFEFGYRSSDHTYGVTVTVTPHPFVYTIAEGGEGGWTWGTQGVTEEIVRAQPTGDFEKAGTGVAEFAPFTNFTHTVKGGTLKFSTEPIRGMNVTVDSGATFDLNGKKAREMNLTLAGGKVTNSSSEALSEGDQIKTITLTADSTIEVPNAYQIYAQSFNTATTIALGTFTLTKTGSAQLKLVNTDITGTGTFLVNEGTVYNGETSRFAEGVTLSIGASGTWEQRDGERKTNVSKVTGAEGGTLNVAGQISGFELTGTLNLTGNGSYGTITNQTGAVANIGTRHNYYTFSGAGGVKAKFSTDPQPGDVVTIFKVADSATTGIAELKKSDDSVIPASYYTYANGVVTFKKEAKSGSSYYFTLAQAISEATEVEMIADVTYEQTINVTKAITFDGGTNILSNVTFTFAEGSGSLTLNTGCIGIGWKSGMSLSGGCCRFNSTTQSDWASHGPSSDYTMAQITAAVRGTYDYEFVKSGFEPEEGKSVIPVADQNGDAGVIKLNSTWVAEKTPGATTAEDQAKILNAPQNNGLMKWQNDVLGLTGTDPNAKPVVHFSQSASESGKIAFTLNGVDGDSGATVKFKVYSASEPGSLSWKAETGETASGSPAEVTLPTSGVRYYRYDVITETSK